MNWVVSMLCGVLYIPLLQIFLSSIKVGFQDHQPALIVLGCVSTILFVPFSFFMSLTYFNPNPKSKSILSRLSASLEIGEMTFRTLVVVLDVFVATQPLIRTIAVLALSTLLSIYVSVYMPYYRKQVNAFRFVLFNLLAFTGLLGTIGASTYKTHDNGNPLFYSFLGLFPVVISIGVVVFEFIYTRKTLKFFRILKRVAKDVPPQQRLLAFETEMSRHKFLSPLTVEVACRFLRDESIFDFAEPDAEVLEIATAIYDRGMKQMKNSPQMTALSAIFQGVYLGDLAQWKGLLEKADSMNPSFFVGMLVAQSVAMRDAEMRKSRSGGNTLDVVDMIEIQNSLSIAKRLSTRVKGDTLQLWRMLLSGKVQPSDIRKYSSKIYNNEATARRMLESCAAKYSEDVRVLSAYGRFLDVEIHFFRKYLLLGNCS